MSVVVIIAQPLQIKSAVAVEGLKGYIYIEAYKQTHVKQVSNMKDMMKQVHQNKKKYSISGIWLLSRHDLMCLDEYDSCCDKIL